MKMAKIIQLISHNGKIIKERKEQSRFVQLTVDEGNYLNVRKKFFLMGREEALKKLKFYFIFFQKFLISKTQKKKS